MKVPPEAFHADYHETDEAVPLMYQLARVSLEWNMVEHFFAALIWEMLGDFRTGKAVTGGMGTQSRADVVLGIARQKLKDPEAIDRIEFACKAFNILRENRNSLIHTHSISPPENGGKPLWRRTGKGQGSYVAVEADVDDLGEIISQICDLGKFVVSLVTHLHPRHRRRLKKLPPLPDKFPLPNILPQIRSEDQPAAPRQRRSSRASSRKASAEAKARR